MAAGARGAGRVFLGRRAGETTPTGDAGAAIDHLIGALERLAALAMVLVVACALTHTSLAPVYDALDRLSGPLAAAGGLGGIVAALRVLIFRPVPATVEVAAVQGHRDGQVTRADVADIKAALAAVGVHPPPAPGGGFDDVVHGAAAEDP